MHSQLSKRKKRTAKAASSAASSEWISGEKKRTTSRSHTEMRRTSSKFTKFHTRLFILGRWYCVTKNCSNNEQSLLRDISGHDVRLGLRIAANLSRMDPGSVGQKLPRISINPRRVRSQQIHHDASECHVRLVPYRQLAQQLLHSKVLCRIRTTKARSRRSEPCNL